MTARKKGYVHRCYEEDEFECMRYIVIVRYVCSGGRSIYGQTLVWDHMTLRLFPNREALYLSVHEVASLFDDIRLANVFGICGRGWLSLTGAFEYLLMPLRQLLANCLRH